jgi:anti-sigma factor RsiW
MKEICGYLDGELDEGLKRSLEAHLTYCDHCHVVFDTTKKTIELYCDGKLFSLPEEVRSRLHEALRRKLQRRS